MRIGARVPTSGSMTQAVGIGVMAAELEQAGFDSLWVSDHIVLPNKIESWYPFSDDGIAPWQTNTPYFDAMIALALMAEATDRASIGTAVLVLPLRHPIVLAKQAASIDAASHGRLRLGLGAGWLREEFDALNVPFEGRGRRCDAWIALLRSCWTGHPEMSRTELYELPAGILCLPAPATSIPLLIGGHSAAALRRAGRVGDGWLAQQALGELDPSKLVQSLHVMRSAAEEAGRDSASLEVVLRIVDTAGEAEQLASRLPELTAAGVTEIIVDVDLAAGGPCDVYARLAEATG